MKTTSETLASLRFTDLDRVEAREAALSLQDALRDEASDVQTRLTKDDPTTMDLGATLVAIFSSASIIALAKGIATWIARQGRTLTIDIDGEKLKFSATGKIDENVVQLVEALRKK